MGYCNNTQGNLLSLKRFANKLKELVLTYYPEVKFTITGNSIDFEYATGTFMIDHFDHTGERKVAREEKGPKPGGILCEISLREGKYSGEAFSPQVFDYKYFKRFLLTPYSPRYNCYLHTRLYYPENTPEQFIQYFTELVNNFDLYLDIKNQPLQLTIGADKQVYEIGEAIVIEAEIINSSKEEKIILNSKEPRFSIATLVWFVNKQQIIPTTECVAMVKQYEYVLKSGEAFKYKKVDISSNFEYLQSNEYIKVFSLPGKYKIHAEYNPAIINPLYLLNKQNKEKYFTGTLTSNTITIEVVEKKKQSFRAMNNLIKSIHKDIMDIQNKYSWLNGYSDNNLQDYDGRLYIQYYSLNSGIDEDVQPQQPDHITVKHIPLDSREFLKYYTDFENINECKFPTLNSKIYGEIVIRGKSNDECRGIVKKIIIDNCQKLQKELFKE